MDYPESWAAAGLYIFGGEIVEKKACFDATGCDDGTDCEPFGCDDVLCPGKTAVFRPWPTNPTAANASPWEWIGQYWEVTEAPPCEAPGTWQPDEPGHPWSQEDITDTRPCLTLGYPGRYRVRTHAQFGYYDCFDPADWCKVTVTDWGGMWSNSSEHTTICIGRTQKLYLWMEPWWLDRGTATLEISDYTGVVRVSPEASMVTILEPVQWDPPHCPADITGDPESDTVDPIADGDVGAPFPVVFDVTGLQEGQVTFTLSFDPGTGASCDPLTFTADVECCCSVCEEEENAQWIDYDFTGIGNCPMNCTLSESAPLEDDCGNQIVLSCGHEGDCNYQYRLNSITLVGKCIYMCGVNAFQVKYNPGKCRIVKTRHRVQDRLPGDVGYAEGCDEGAEGLYDWQVYVYDACTGTGTGYCREGPVVKWEDGGVQSDCEAAWW